MDDNALENDRISGEATLRKKERTGTLIKTKKMIKTILPLFLAGLYYFF